MRHLALGLSHKHNVQETALEKPFLQYDFVQNSRELIFSEAVSFDDNL